MHRTLVIAIIACACAFAGAAALITGCDTAAVAPGVEPAGDAHSHMHGHVEAGETPPILARELTTKRGNFTDDVRTQIRYKLDGRPTAVLNARDASHVAVLEITVQPGATFPWHTHPGPVIVTVVEGEIVYVLADDCVERPYEAGTAFIDPGHGVIHRAFNPSATNETLLIATFLEAPATGPLTIPVAGDPAVCPPPG